MTTRAWTLPVHVPGFFFRTALSAKAKKDHPPPLPARSRGPPKVSSSQAGIVAGMTRCMISPRPTASTEGRLHLKYLDGLRAVAAVWVVLAHALAQVDPDFGTLGTWRAGGVIAVFSYGRFAVDLFIVLSGFCLMLPVVRRDGVMRYGSLEFLRRRGWRILPPYYLALIFSLALIWLAVGSKTGTHWDISLPVTPKSILTHLLLFQDAFGEISPSTMLCGRSAWNGGSISSSPCWYSLAKGSGTT